MMNILLHYIDRISFSLLGLWTGARSQSFASDIWAASSPGAGRTVGRPEVKITSQSTSQSTATTATTSTTDIHLSVSSYQYMYTHNLDIVASGSLMKVKNDRELAMDHHWMSIFQC